MGQTVAGTHEFVGTEFALYTQQIVVGRPVSRFCAHDAVVPDQQIHLAAGGAVGACGPDLPDLPAAVLLVVLG